MRNEFIFYYIVFDIWRDIDWEGEFFDFIGSDLDFVRD